MVAFVVTSGRKKNLYPYKQRTGTTLKMSTFGKAFLIVLDEQPTTNPDFLKDFLTTQKKL